MAQYIDKSVLVTEIKKLLDRYISVHTFNYGATQDLNHLLSFIDTLEVKDVDLNATDKQKQQWVEKACDVYCKDCEYIGCDKFECLALEKFRKAMEE